MMLTPELPAECAHELWVGCPTYCANCRTELCDYLAVQRAHIRGLEAQLAARGTAIDAAHLERQRAFSRETFGPGTRTKGVSDHIRKELKEIELEPLDLEEWVDVIILAFDGAWRAGHEPPAIIDAIKAKQAKNERRPWPDWRTADPEKAIEHVRTTAAPLGDA